MPHQYEMRSRSLTCLQAASIPEGQNELKRNQLRELAALNGTLRDDENQACQNCGEIGHRKYDCPQARNYTASIICRVCGNAGHMARDCPDRARGNDWRNLPPRRPAGDALDKDYENLMNELGGGTASDPSRQIGWQEGGAPGDNGDGQPTRPWQRGPTGAPAPWEQPRQNNAAPWQQRDPPGAPAPWMNRGGHDNHNGNHNAPPPSGGGPPPWMQNRNGHAPPPWQSNAPGYGAPGMDYNAPPPPPPADLPPPPPPNDVPPPPPPPPA